MILPPDPGGPPEQTLALLDGLLLAGGSDIDPGAYGASPHPATRGVEAVQDAAEIALTTVALDMGIPVLGICRGMQLLNVACGGTLIQHLPEHAGHERHRPALGSFDGAEHDVRLEEGSLAARAAGATLHPTRHHHHQGVDRIGGGLRVTGWSVIDDLPEAIEAPEKPFVLGVQWHPEVDPASRVIASFVAACAGAA